MVVVLEVVVVLVVVDNAVMLVFLSAHIHNFTRSLGALRAPISCWWPFKSSEGQLYLHF